MSDFKNIDAVYDAESEEKVCQKLPCSLLEFLFTLIAVEITFKHVSTDDVLVYIESGKICFKKKSES